MKTFPIDAARRAAAAAVLGALLLAASPAFAADDDQPADTMPAPAPAMVPDDAAPPPPPPGGPGAPGVHGPAMHDKPAMHDEDMDARIQHLHDQLKITPDEEPLWSKVAQVMHDNAAATSAALKERDDKSGDMTAIDDIRSYQAITAAHADGLARLADAFGPLYDAMPAAQQANADKIFGHMHHEAEHVHQKTK